MSSRRIGVSLVVVLLLTVVTAFSSPAAFWGRQGHDLVGAAATRALPGEMPAFFRGAAAQLTYLNYEPDRWRDDAEFAMDRAMGTTYSPEHYINFEGVPDEVFEAENRYEFLERLREADLEDPNIGFLPFRMLELAQLLRSDFRRWRRAQDADVRRWLEARIINDAGILGHYVADGANPHHTSIHYNGWVGPNPKGYSTARDIHSRFETQYVAARVGLEDVLPMMSERPTTHRDLRAAIMAYLRASHDQLDRLYALEKVESFGPAVTRPEHKAFTAGRLAAGATMLRDLWWSAWITSE